MASKSSSIRFKAIIFQVLFHLVVSAIVSSQYHGLHKYLEQGSRGHYSLFITLIIKFLHFFASKALQFRFLLPMLQPVSSIPSMLFWVAFTRSVSSMSHDS
ncbi:hypothetical protein AB3S75_014591 [Citrus x aurantiifolia]